MKKTSTLKHTSRSFFFLILVFLPSLSGNAQSMLGAELAYLFSKEKGLEITLNTYSFCDASSHPEALINIRDGKNYTSGIVLNFISSEDITPLCAGLESKCKNPNSTFPYGIRKNVYKGTIAIPALSDCKLSLSWNGGKRSAAINNLGAGQDFFIEASFNTCETETNQSPEFEFLPITNIYTKQKINLYQSAKDVEGDSLVYKVIAPKKSLNTDVNFQPGFFANQAFGADSNFSFSQKDGLVNVNVSQPGVYAVAYKVESWGKKSNGEFYLKGETVREAATIVTENTGQNLPQLTGINGNATSKYGEFPPGKPIHYGINTYKIGSRDLDINDSLTINWNYGIKENTIVYIDKIFKYPVLSLNHNTEKQELGTIKKFTFIATVTDDGCPLRSTTNKKFNVVIASHEKLVENNDFYICKGEAVKLKTIGGKNHKWKKDHPLTGGEIDTTVLITHDSTTKYFVSAIDRYLNCHLSEIITVHVGEDCVWPGETNKDGEVNVKDVLPIGVAFNTEGKERPYQSTEWKAWYSEEWPSSLTNEINNKHLDCNGDSVINATDTEAILKNYTTQPDASLRFKDGNNGDPELGLYFPRSYYFKGENVKINLLLGTNSVVAKDMYGLALRFAYDSALIEPGSIKMTTSGSWLLNQNAGEGLYFAKDFPEKGILDLVLCRTDHQSANGKDEIATLEFSLQNNIKGKHPLHFRLLDAKVINAKYEDRPIKLAIPDKNVFVYQDRIERGLDSINGHSNLGNQEIRIIPNPEDNSITVVDTEEQIGYLRLTNVLGQILAEQNTLKNNRHLLKLNTLPSGVYYISVLRNNEIKTKAFVITR